MGGPRDDNYEELVPMVDSVFKMMNPALNEPIDCRKVLELLNEIFCLDLDRERSKMYKFIRFRWKQFKSQPIVRIKRNHMNMRVQNFIRNLKGTYMDEKDGVELVMEHSIPHNHNNEGEGDEINSELSIPTNLTGVEINKMDKDKKAKLQQLASKESSRAKHYVHKGLVKGSEKNIRFNKLAYKTSDLIYGITGLRQGTRFEIIKAIRDYIDKHDLKSKDPNSSDQFDCDDKLKAVFGNYFTFTRLRKIPADRLLRYRNGSAQQNIEVITVNGEDNEADVNGKGDEDNKLKKDYDEK